MQSNNSGSIVWYTEYDFDKPPEKTSKDHIRFIVLSDTHSTEPQVPDGDVLLHSGDLTDMGTTKSFQRHLNWLSTLPHRFKFIIAGNHDFALCSRDGWYGTRGKEIHRKYKYEEANVDDVKQIIRDWESNQEMTHKYLEDEKAIFEIDGRKWSIYGSPWTPMFGNWAWNYERGEEAKKLYSQMPSTDILLTHGPPHSLGDLDVLEDKSTHVGCEELTEKLTKGEIQPIIYAFGHIHEAHGTHLQTIPDKADDKSSSEILLVNSSIVEFDMDHFVKEKALHYNIKHQPIIVDINQDRCKRQV